MVAGKVFSGMRQVAEDGIELFHYLGWYLRVPVTGEQGDEIEKKE